MADVPVARTQRVSGRLKDASKMDKTSGVDLFVLIYLFVCVCLVRLFALPVWVCRSRHATTFLRKVPSAPRKMKWIDIQGFSFSTT